MHLVNDFSEEVRELTRQLEQLYRELRTQLDSPYPETLEAQRSFTLPLDFPDGFSLITEGTATVVMNGRAICHFSEGDFFGFPFERKANGWEIRTDFAIQIERFSLREILKKVTTESTIAQSWNRILSLQSAIYLSLFAEQCDDELSIFPALRFYEAGQEIIKEGEIASEVFTLVEGSADVLHEGVSVGSIGADEIFGALAALTNTTRTATVIALERCTVAVLPVASFRNLIHSRPQTTEKLIADFAKKIIQLNARVAARE